MVLCTIFAHIHSLKETPASILHGAGGQVSEEGKNAAFYNVRPYLLTLGDYALMLGDLNRKQGRITTFPLDITSGLFETHGLSRKYPDIPLWGLL